jgi:GNAT superfamily N-acetyltransferase
LLACGTRPSPTSNAGRALGSVPASRRRRAAPDLATAIEQLGDRPGERLVVAEFDGEFAGAAFLKAGTYSPVNPEPVLQVHNAAVVPAFRRRGIGKALVESAVTWAEELGIGHVATATASGSREANRFMARLALGPQAVLRMAPTPRSARSWWRATPPRARSRRCSRCVAACARAVGRPALVPLLGAAAAQVIRQVHTRRSCSSVITTSYDVIAPPEVQRRRDAGHRAARSRRDGGWR